MSPRSSTLLALLGVLLAGIPLPALTATRREAPADATATPAPARPHARPTCITLRCSGRPAELHLLHDGQALELYRAEGDSAGLWEAELTLPAGSHVALEVAARWNEATAPQAVTLLLEAEGLPLQQHTEWTEEGSNTLHCLFPFSW